MAKTANMAARATKNLAELIQKEIDSACPEESMSRWLQDIDGNIQSSTFKDGQLVLEIRRNHECYLLTLQPTGWTRKKT